jgi:hypothetical protein
MVQVILCHVDRSGDISESFRPEAIRDSSGALGMTTKRDRACMGSARVPRVRFGVAPKQTPSVVSPAE